MHIRDDHEQSQKRSRVPGAAHHAAAVGVSALLGGCFPWDYNKAKDKSDAVENTRIVSFRFLEGDVLRPPLAGGVAHYTLEFTVETELDHYGYNLNLSADAGPATAASSASGASTGLSFGGGTVDARTPLTCTADRHSCKIDCTYQVHAANAQLRDLNCAEDKATQAPIVVAPGRHEHEFTLYASTASNFYPWTPFSHQDIQTSTLTLE